MHSFDIPMQSLVESTERALAKSFGKQVMLGHALRLDSSPRSEVYRIPVLEWSLSSPHTLIVKRVLERDGFLNEWTGVQFLTSVAGERPVAPTFYTGDEALGLIIMSDIGEGDGLHTFLLGHDSAAAEQALLRWATALGRMHALTVGKQHEYGQLRKSVELGQNTGIDTRYTELAPLFSHLVGEMELPFAPGAELEVRTLTETMMKPGPFTAYTHGDPCPDNVILVDGQFRFIDFESGMFRHAMMDASFARLNFPWCWCSARLPEHLPLLMETTYRAELVKGCSEAADDTQFFHALTEGCAAWILLWSKWIPLKRLLTEDITEDYATARQKMLFRLNTFVQMTRAFGHLEAMGETVHHIVVELRKQWPLEAQTMPYYPAFQ